jgi:hypothetical protein
LGNLVCRGLPRGWLFFSGTLSSCCPGGATELLFTGWDPYYCGMPGEDPNAWKHFGPEPDLVNRSSV